MSTVRRPTFAGPDICDAAGMKIDFPRTKAERLATGDPRHSIEERYQIHESYVNRVTAAALKLRGQRLMLDEDVERYGAAASDRHIGK